MFVNLCNMIQYMRTSDMVLVPLSVNLEVWQKSSDLNTDGQKFGVDLFIGNCKHFFGNDEISERKFVFIARIH